MKKIYNLHLHDDCLHRSFNCSPHRSLQFSRGLWILSLCGIMSTYKLILGSRVTWPVSAFAQSNVPSALPFTLTMPSRNHFRSPRSLCVVGVDFTLNSRMLNYGGWVLNRFRRRNAKTTFDPQVFDLSFHTISSH